MRRLAGAAIAAFAVSCVFLWDAAPDGDVTELHRYGDAVLAGRLPYRDFSIEYPPGAIPFFTLPALGDFVTWFRVENAIGWALVIALTGALLAAVGARRAEQAAVLAAVALVPAVLGPFTLMRFDAWPVALVLGALLALLRRHPTLALALLAVATVVKAWPLLLLPLFLVHRVPRRAVAAFAAVVLVVLLPFALIAPHGSYNAGMSQVNRHLQLETIGSSALLVLERPVRIAFDAGSWSVFGGGADALAKLQTAAQLAGVAAAALLYARSRREPRDLVLAAAATVAATAFLGKVLSPQYLLWAAPLVLLSASLPAMLLLVGAALATNALFPERYDALLARADGEVWLLAARNLLLLAALAALCLSQAKAVRRPRAARAGNTA